MAMDLNSWKKNRDGSYTGTLHMVPDRGWNTERTVDYRGRVHRFDVTLRPFIGASTTAQNQLTTTYRGSILLHEAGNRAGRGRGPTDKDGTPTIGLDPLDVRPGFFGFPDLPVGGRQPYRRRQRGHCPRWQRDDVDQRRIRPLCLSLRHVGPAARSDQPARRVHPDAPQRQRSAKVSRAPTSWSIHQKRCNVIRCNRLVR
jgi:hypothetical protein